MALAADVIFAIAPGIIRHRIQRLFYLGDLLPSSPLTTMGDADLISGPFQIGLDDRLTSASENAD